MSTAELQDLTNVLPSVPDDSVGSVKVSCSVNVVRSLNFEEVSAVRPPPLPRRSVETTRSTRDSRRSLVSGSVKADCRAEAPESKEIKVFLRVRPRTREEIERGETQAVYIAEDKKEITICGSSQASSAREHGGSVFRFAEVFDESTSQHDVFAKSALPLVHDLFRGKDGLLFAFGMTNAGKTYTIQGSPSDGGIIPRTMDVVLRTIHSLPEGGGLFLRPDDLEVDSLLKNTSDETKNEIMGGIHHEQPWKEEASIHVEGSRRFRVLVSYLEIYNEQCFDLLEETPSDGGDGSALSRMVKSSVLKRLKKRKVLKIKEDVNGRPFVDALTQTTVRSLADVEKLIQFGIHNRRVAETLANNKSSRSHTIFTITLERYDITEEQPAPLVSRLCLVDLAGSERTSRTEATGMRLREAAQINTSLMNLSRCLETLRENQKIQSTEGERSQKRLALVPYRQSKLTRLFQENFESGSAVMIAAVSPCAKDADETIHGLKCTAIAQEVRVAPGRDKRVLIPATLGSAVDSNLVRELQSQLEQYKIAFEDEKFRSGELEVELYEARDRVVFLEEKLGTLEEEIRMECAEEMSDALDVQRDGYEERIQELERLAEEKLESRLEIVTKTCRKRMISRLKQLSPTGLGSPDTVIDDSDDEDSDEEAPSSA